MKIGLINTKKKMTKEKKSIIKGKRNTIKKHNNKKNGNITNKDYFSFYFGKKGIDAKIILDHFKN